MGTVWRSRRNSTYLGSHWIEFCSIAPERLGYSAPCKLQLKLSLSLHLHARRVKITRRKIFTSKHTFYVLDFCNLWFSGLLFGVRWNGSVAVPNCSGFGGSLNSDLALEKSRNNSQLVIYFARECCFRVSLSLLCCFSHVTKIMTSQMASGEKVQTTTNTWWHSLWQRYLTCLKRTSKG